jgi:prepilin-type N-terminal cleavage/methylation domain-containing protein
MIVRNQRPDAGIGLALPFCRVERRRTVTTHPFMLAIPSSYRRFALGARRGFTLIELLIVVVIIGILTAIAIPKFAATKGKANFAAMKSDLHNLTTAEESFFYDSATYTNSVTKLQFPGSHGDAISITEATSTGWSATVTNPDSWPHFCALFIGTAAAVPPATASGVVACQ